MLTLSSTASKARGMEEYQKSRGKETKPFNQGDVITTVVRCANGETITLELNTNFLDFMEEAFPYAEQKECMKKLQIPYF